MASRQRGVGNMAGSSPDVVVVGGSLAGCMTAMLLARQGAHVMVLEQHRDPAHYKRACTHYIQPGATPVFGRLGLAERMEKAGAIRNAADLWTRYGWVRAPGNGDYGYNLRRSVLDPMVRSAAADTPGVDMRLGVKARQVVREGGRVAGVVADTGDGEEEFRAQLIVGADGRHSPVAGWAQVPVKQKMHGRFIYFASFQGISHASGFRSQVWLTDPDILALFPNDSGITVLTVAQTSDKQERFQRDIDASFRAAFAEIPDGPDLSGATRVSDYVGVLNYTNVSRKAGTSGLALVGDAALTTDYSWAVGCGWAVQSADWLAEAAGPALAAKEGPAQVDRAVDRYARRHRKELAGHHYLIADQANGRRLNPLERLLFAAAAQDEALASNLARFGARLIKPSQFLTARTIAQSIRVRAAASRRRQAHGPGHG